MRYFSTLPKILQVGDNGNITNVLTNLVTRASLDETYLSNPVLYYQYTIQDGDTPEIIAHKYYGDSYRYWIILLVNNIFDPEWDWPMTSYVLDKYITDKYKDFDPYTTVHHYEETTTKFDQGTQTTTVEVLVIDETTFNSFVPSTNTFTLPSGNVTVTTSAQAISYYDYEVRLNESKRNIKLLISNYVSDLEKKFIALMS